MARRSWFRWKAIAPLTVMLVFMALVWWLLLDRLVERSVEAVGSAIVGARVDLAGADVRLTEGHITLRGLEVTNPDRPMTNLFQAEEIIVDLRLAPLLAKKVFIDTVAVRARRFKTPRETSGAIDEPSEASQAIREQVDAWAERVAIPPFSLGGLGEAINVDAINPDSLQGRSPRNLGVAGTLGAVRTARDMIGRIGRHQATLVGLDDSVATLVTGGRGAIASLDALRARDIAYARGLLQIPSLDAPDLGPSILGRFAVDQVRSLMYGLNAAERYLPPGLDPRRRSGPVRARRAGTTVEFPSAAAYPAFSLLFGEAGVTIDDGPASGVYRALFRNVSSAPAALGLPLVIEATRAGADTMGLSDVGVALLLDHTGEMVRDSGSLRLAGMRLPSIELPGLGTTLDLGTGATRVTFLRSGDSVVGQMEWTANQVAWSPDTGPIGSLLTELRSVVESIQSVNIEVRFAGRVTGPGLSVRSNLGTVVAAALRERLGEEIARAEESVRAEIDRRVEGPVNAYRQRVQVVENELRGKIQGRRARLQLLQRDLEARIRELTRGPPPGILR